MTFSATEKSMDRSLSKKDFMQAGLEMGPSMHETCKRGQDPQRKAEACVLLVPQLESSSVAWKKFWVDCVPTELYSQTAWRLCLEKESRGRVDYAIKEAEDLICITEDKQHKVPIGFAQNIKQLKSACETNKRKRKRGDDDFDYLHVIVITGRDWHFLLYSPGKISKASDTAYSIEFTKKALDSNSEEYQSLRKSVRKVLGIIVAKG
ncbi:hypothetical protein GLOIN_2v1695250 [Rhizophagus irregularis DAOM 181602=DAOM 197198]|nr:hypothetical protein GLOIN_2v1695250 [Rhizophagus irregularis DAOM 181602=DAOM 197198]